MNNFPLSFHLPSSYSTASDTLQDLYLFVLTVLVLTSQSGSSFSRWLLSSFFHHLCFPFFHQTDEQFCAARASISKAKSLLSNSVMMMVQFLAHPNIACESYFNFLILIYFFYDWRSSWIEFKFKADKFISYIIPLPASKRLWIFFLIWFLKLLYKWKSWKA